MIPIDNAWPWYQPIITARHMAEYLGQSRAAVRFTPPRTLDEIKADARAAGLIVCDCLRTPEGKLIIHPRCVVHAGQCSNVFCTHHHF